MITKNQFKGVWRRAFLISTISGVVLVATSAAALGATSIQGSDNAGPTASTLETNCPSYDYDAYVGEVGVGTAGGGVDHREGINPSPNYNNSSMINSAYCGDPS